MLQLVAVQQRHVYANEYSYDDSFIVAVKHLVMREIIARLKITLCFVKHGIYLFHR